jgi:hypothetical protein
MFSLAVSLANLDVRAECIFPRAGDGGNAMRMAAEIPGFLRDGVGSTPTPSGLRLVAYAHTCIWVENDAPCRFS